MSGLSNSELSRVVIVLVRARNPANIGAVARAMHDFGFGTLRVVNEFPVPFEAAKSAVDASAVMANAASYTTVADAVADCTLVVGTTAVGERELRHELLTLNEAAPRIRSELTQHDRRVALLFGSEKTGLSNDELSFCHFLLTIPMQQYEGLRHPSMNLGQAVAVCLWELVRESTSSAGAPFMARSDMGGVDSASLERPGAPFMARSDMGGVDSASLERPGAPVILSEAHSAQSKDIAQQWVESNPPAQPESSAGNPADSASLERLHSLLMDVLEATEYTRRHAANCDPAHIRRLVRRIGVDAVDAPVWMGIFRQVLWKLSK